MPSIINHRRRVNVQDTPWTVFNLVSDYSPDNSGSIVVPEGQREWAWKSKRGHVKMQKLIDSVFYGFPIPSLILNKRRSNRNYIYEVYDGRHRIETLWKYYHDEFKWQDHLYSELSDEDKRLFCERTIPATITQGATAEQLADMFIRLNAGVPLKDYDLLWANRARPLVRATREIVCNNARLSAALGGLTMTNRADLANWTAMVAGLSSQNAGNMTTSFIRLAGDPGLGLDMDVNEDNVRAGIDAYCNLLEMANIAFPPSTAEQRKFKKVGKIAAFFFAEWMSSANKIAVQGKWHEVIGRLRSDAVVAGHMSNALHTTGAQNLTASKIEETLAQVDAYLAGVEPLNMPLDEDDSDSDD